jgi:hypothetical protein
MRILHDSAPFSHSLAPEIPLLSAPRIAGLLPATTHSSRQQVEIAAAPLLDTAERFLEGRADDLALITAFSHFYSQLAKGKSIPPLNVPRPQSTMREQMDAEIASMVEASRQRLDALKRSYSL